MWRMNQVYGRRMIGLVGLGLWGFLGILPQAGNAQNFRFGLYGEGQLTWMSTAEEHITAKGVRFGAGFGLWAEWFFAENYGFASGLGISYQGGMAEYLDTVFFRRRIRGMDTLIRGEPGVSVVYSYRYAEIPFTLKFRTNEMGYLRYFGQFGGVLGIAWQVYASTEDIPDFQKKRIYDAEPLNVQFVVSLGIEYTLAENTALLARVAYYGGLMDVVGHRAWHSGDIGKVQLNGVRLTVGVLF